MIILCYHQILQNVVYIVECLECSSVCPILACQILARFVSSLHIFRILPHYMTVVQSAHAIETSEDFGRNQHFDKKTQALDHQNKT